MDVECLEEGHLVYTDDVEFRAIEVEETGWGSETITIPYAFCPQCNDVVELEYIPYRMRSSYFRYAR